MTWFPCWVRNLVLMVPCWLALLEPACSEALSYRVQWQSGAKGGQVAQIQTWYLLRDAERAVVQRPELEDIWTRSAEGLISFERVFHAERSVVSYTAGELKTLRVYPDWDSLATLFDVRKLSQLQRLRRDDKAGVTRYRGRIGHEQIEVDWLDNAGVAQRVLRREQGRSVRFTLLAHHASPPSTWPAPAQGLDAYQRYDAADFGDMEDNPVIRKASHMDVLAGWRQPHEHE